MSAKAALFLISDILFIKETHSFFVFFFFLRNNRFFFFVHIIKLVFHCFFTFVTETTGFDHLSASFALKTYRRCFCKSKTLFTNPSFDLRNRNLTFFRDLIDIGCRISSYIFLGILKLFFKLFTAVRS